MRREGLAFCNVSDRLCGFVPDVRKVFINEIQLHVMLCIDSVETYGKTVVDHVFDGEAAKIAQTTTFAAEYARCVAFQVPAGCRRAVEM